MSDCLFPGQRAKYFAEGQDKKEKGLQSPEAAGPELPRLQENVMEKIKFLGSEGKGVKTIPA